MPEVTFLPFRPHSEMTIYRRNMPHWRQRGCTYFITFRLADSIPRQVLSQWREERHLWLKAHHVTDPLDRDEGMRQYLCIDAAERRRFERQQARHLHRELDRCHGACVLAAKLNRQSVEAALHYFHGSRLWCGDFVVMPNHVHWLMTPLDDWQVEDLLQSIKRFTSTELFKHGVSNDKLWQKESFDRIVRDRKELRAYREYIAKNPDKAKLSGASFSLHQAGWITEILKESIPSG